MPGGIDNSKWILGWKRLLVWAGHDISRGVTTVLALRCPADMKANLVAAFADRGRVVKQQPMLLHAFFVQNALQKADKFSESWADPIYEWVRTRFTFHCSLVKALLNLTSRGEIVMAAHSSSAYTGIKSQRTLFSRRFYCS